jgi:hypothetical protein
MLYIWLRSVASRAQNAEDAHIELVAWAEGRVVEASNIGAVQIIEQHRVNDALHGYSPYILRRQEGEGDAVDSRGNRIGNVHGVTGVQVSLRSVSKVISANSPRADTRLTESTREFLVRKV